MCTVSWCFFPGGYQLFFNRDEQRSRPWAEPPQCFEYSGGTAALMPIDPQGKGSWIAVNNRGLTLALLNFYQGEIPPGTLLSRGQIVKQAAGLASTAQVKAWLHSLNLRRYPPFALVVFEPRRVRAERLLWRGNRLDFSDAESPEVSSSVAFEAVFAARRALFLTATKNALNADSLAQFHASHQAGPSAYSVCMHRQEAATVSQTQVRVEEAAVTMSYLPCAPCSAQATALQSYSLPRLAAQGLNPSG